MECCEMKGYLSYLILWILSKKEMTGAEITKELEKRRGQKPSPGTIYPALKELKKNGMINCNDKKRYTLSNKGKKELKTACNIFCKVFYDVKEMFESK